jgi:hypothetical protein
MRLVPKLSPKTGFCCSRSGYWKITDDYGLVMYAVVQNLHFTDYTDFMNFINFMNFMDFMNFINFINFINFTSPISPKLPVASVFLSLTMASSLAHSIWLSFSDIFDLWHK